MVCSFKQALGSSLAPDLVGKRLVCSAPDACQRSKFLAKASLLEKVSPLSLVLEQASLLMLLMRAGHIGAQTISVRMNARFYGGLGFTAGCSSPSFVKASHGSPNLEKRPSASTFVTSIFNKCTHESHKLGKALSFRWQHVCVQPVPTGYRRRLQLRLKIWVS